MGKTNGIVPRRSERLLNRHYSLPMFEEKSSNEADEDAIHELNELTNEEYISQCSSSDESIGSSENEDETSEEDDTIDEDNWTDYTKPLDEITETFDGDAEVGEKMGEKEVDFFRKLLDESIIQRIVDETNLYSNQKQSKNWVPLTCQEFTAFIGMLILMGIHQLPSLKCYWSSDPILRVDAVAQVMPASRYKKIVENLHLNDNTKQLPRNDANYDKLHKLRPLLDHLMLSIKFTNHHHVILSMNR